MKVWEKNYFYTLLLFVIFFFACIMIIVQTSFSAMLTTERDSAMNQTHFISRAVASDISALENRNADSSHALDNIISSYVNHYKKLGITISLFDSEGTLFSNNEVETSTYALENAMICTIETIDSSKYINIINALQETSGTYYLVYIKNIDDIYYSQNRRTAFLVALSVGVAIILACGLYFTLNRLYRPLNNLAHELRTPLTSIQGYAQYLQIAALGDKERYKATQFIIDESHRLAEITNNLLIMANVREGRIEKSKVNIKTVFESTKMAFKNVDYNIEQKYFSCNQALIQSLVNNLVSNAVKATTEKQNVMLKAYDNIIEVADHGKGMSAEKLSHANNPFARSKTGSGLGIPLCHQIVKLHKAKLMFSSTLGEGTTAKITFTTR